MGAEGAEPGGAVAAPLGIFGSVDDDFVRAETLERLYGRVPARAALTLVPGRSHRALKEDHVLSDLYAFFLACHLKGEGCDAACGDGDSCQSK